jgi:hypothetical protein
MSVNRRIYGFLASLSLANLCFLTVWRELVFADATDIYWMPDYKFSAYLAIILNVILFTIFLYIQIQYLSRSSRNWIAIPSRLIILSVLVFPINYVRLALHINEWAILFIKNNLWLSVPITLMVFMLILYLVIFWLRKTVILVVAICFLFFPLALTNLGQAIFQGLSLLPTSPSTALQEEKPGDRPKQRVLWLLMDELDLRLAFLDPPDGLKLPEFERLRNESIFSPNAASHSRSTEEAIPSFLVQKIVDKALPIGPADLGLDFKDFENHPPAMFSDMGNFFAYANDLGARIAIIGYYHPYCRIFEAIVSFCRNFSVNTYTPYATSVLHKEMLAQILGITPFYRRINGIKTYLDSLSDARNIVATDSYDLIYIHASVPHGPNIWDLDREKYSLFITSEEGYFGNLVLADRMLGAIRKSMEDADLWATTAILLTSDHEWRHTRLYDNIRVRKIPYVLKMPFQRSAIVFDKKFAPMLVTKDLLLSILKKDVDSVDSAITWLGRRAEEYELGEIN